MQTILRVGLVAAFATMAACGGRDRDTTELGSADEDMVPIATDEPTIPEEMPPAPKETVYVATQPPPPPPAPRPAPPRPAPPPAPRPTPAPTPAPPPAPAALVLASGTTVPTTTVDSVHSRYSRVGDLVKVRVSRDVADGNGKVVIPAGSIVTLAITEIASAGTRGGTGTLVMASRNVVIDGNTYDLTANATDFEYEMRGRGVGTSEVAKTGAGAVAGAIIGRVVGGKKGTVVGAAGGAAVGAAVADHTQDRDLVVSAGKPITITLRDSFSRPAGE